MMKTKTQLLHRLHYCVAPFYGLSYEIKNIVVGRAKGKEFATYSGHVTYSWEKGKIPTTLQEFREARKKLMEMKKYIEENKNGKVARA